MQFKIARRAILERRPNGVCKFHLIQGWIATPVEILEQVNDGALVQPATELVNEAGDMASQIEQPVIPRPTTHGVCMGDIDSGTFGEAISRSY